MRYTSFGKSARTRWDSWKCKARILRGLHVTFQGWTSVVSDPVILTWSPCRVEDGLHPYVPRFLAILFNFVGTSQRRGSRVWFDELKQLCILKRNSCFPGTMLRFPRAGRTVVEGIPSRDDGGKNSLFTRWLKPLSVTSTSIEFLGNGIMMLLCSFSHILFGLYWFLSS